MDYEVFFVLHLNTNWK